MQQTSRHRLLDAVELIWQQCALVSHCQEIIDSYWTSEEVTIEDVTLAEETIINCNSVRRNIMQNILLHFKWNKLYWCQVKHSVFAYELSCELLYADWNNISFLENQRKCAENMYKILSKFINQDVVVCWRCLNDALEVNDKKDDK